MSKRKIKDNMSADSKIASVYIPYTQFNDDSNDEKTVVSTRDLRMQKLQKTLEGIGVIDNEALTHDEQLEIINTAKKSMSTYDLEITSCKCLNPLTPDNSSSQGSDIPSSDRKLFDVNDNTSLCENNSGINATVIDTTKESLPPLNCKQAEENDVDVKIVDSSSEKKIEYSSTPKKRLDTSDLDVPNSAKKVKLTEEITLIDSEENDNFSAIASEFNHQFKLAFIRWKSIMSKFKHPMKMKRISVSEDENEVIKSDGDLLL